MVSFVVFFCAMSALFYACIAAFLVTLAKKWGFVEWLQVHGNSFFSKMAHCDLCLSFWASMLVACVAFVITGDARVLIAGLVSVTVTRKLL